MFKSNIVAVFSFSFIVTCFLTILQIVKVGNRTKLFLSYLSTYFFPSLSFKASHVRIVQKNHKIVGQFKTMKKK